MNPFRWLRRRDDELDEEIRGHLEQARRELIEGGQSPEQAEQAARREFGNVALVKEVTREMWGWGSLERLAQDVRYGLRMLRKSPAFTATAVITLALGSGANTAVFSMVDAVLLKSLPLREPGRLFLVADPDAFKGDLFRRSFFEELRERNTVFEGVCTFSSGVQTWSASARGTSEPVQALLASGDYHSVLGVKALLGRTLTPADELGPGSPVAVISQGFWTRRFGRSASAVGETLTLNGGLFTIVGVTPAEFFGVTPGQSPDITVPHRSVAGALPQFSNIGMRILGRLRGDVGLAQAQAGLTLLHQQRLAADAGPKLTPERQREITRRRLMLEPAARGVATLRRQLSKPLWLLASLVGLLLLIACANIANLLMARSSARQAELAMRAALGASRARLLRQLLTEGFLLACLGGAAGVLLAAMAAPLLQALASGGRLTLPVSALPDARVLGFTLLLAALVSLLFGAVPALHATRLDSTAALKHRHAAARGPALLGRPLLAAQVALSLVLLVGAGLFLRSLQNLVRLDAGFEGERVLLFSVDPTLRGHTGERFHSVAREVLDATSALPGVRSGAYSDMGLLGAGYSSGPVAVGEDASVTALVNRVSPRYFETMGMRLALGRDFSPAEDASAPRVAIVNESFARRFFGNRPALGATFHFGGSTREIEIVGVARDAKYHDLRAAIEPTVFLPAFQAGRERALTFAVRAEGDPRALVPSLRERIAELDPDLMLYDIKTQSEQTGQSLAVDRLIAALSAFFGALALLLACVGLFGVTAYNTARRTAEIGVRMALGARRADVIALVMRGALVPTAVGLCVGLGLAFAAARLVESLLFGLTPGDPATLSLALLLLLAAAAGAALLPAWRASRLDPQVALRCE